MPETSEVSGYGWDTKPDKKPRITRRKVMGIGAGLLATCVTAAIAATLGDRRADQVPPDQKIDARQRNGAKPMGPPDFGSAPPIHATPITRVAEMGSTPEIHATPLPIPQILTPESTSSRREARRHELKAAVQAVFVPHDKWPTDRKEHPQITERFPKDRLTGIVVHHTATPNDRTPKQDLTALMSTGALPYHFVIDREGKIYGMTDSMMDLPNEIPVGEHAKGYNGAQNTLARVGGSIGVAVLGQYEKNPQDLNRLEMSKE